MYGMRRSWTRRRTWRTSTPSASATCAIDISGGLGCGGVTIVGISSVSTFAT